MLNTNFAPKPKFSKKLFNIAGVGYISIYIYIINKRKCINNISENIIKIIFNKNTFLPFLKSQVHWRWLAFFKIFGGNRKALKKIKKKEKPSSAGGLKHFHKFQEKIFKR